MRPVRFSGSPAAPALLVPLVLLTLLAVAGCSSISVHRAEDAPASGRPVAPARIYVQEFAAPAGNFRVDRGGEAFAKFRAALSRSLAAAIAQRAGKRLAPATVVPLGHVPPRSAAWLVTGRFVRVNQGSRVLRAAVGLGLGGTKLETEIVVFDLSGPWPREVMRFRTTGGSNSQPGAVFGLVLPNMWLLSLDLLVRLGPGLQADMFRTSRQIVAVLSERMVRDGFLPSEKVYRAKKLGQWP